LVAVNARYYRAHKRESFASWGHRPCQIGFIRIDAAMEKSDRALFDAHQGELIAYDSFTFIGAHSGGSATIVQSNVCGDGVADFHILPSGYLTGRSSSCDRHVESGADRRMTAWCRVRS
jgi:hypothetical protein